MNELISSNEMRAIVLLLAGLVSLASLGASAYLFQKQTDPFQKKIVAFSGFLGILAGPLVWVLWKVYNALENYYGLDSLKALGFNLIVFIAAGIMGAFCFVKVPFWMASLGKGHNKKRILKHKNNQKFS
jgi:hypothetical protein